MLLVGGMLQAVFVVCHSKCILLLGGMSQAVFVLFVVCHSRYILLVGGMLQQAVFCPMATSAAGFWAYRSIQAIPSFRLPTCANLCC